MGVKILTYNIRHGQGVGFKYTLKKIAELIKDEKPDFVGLNEVFYIPYIFNQPKRIAELTSMHYVFQTNVSFGPFGGYGNLILSKNKIDSVKDIRLPRHLGIEPRGLLVACAKAGGVEVCFGTTHLSLGSFNRKKQIVYLKDRLALFKFVILAGDLNATVTELEPLYGQYNLAGEYNTYPSVHPTRQYDYVFYDNHFRLASTGTINSFSSDHLPVFASFELKR